MNRKHLRSLAAVQRGKKNVRSLEEKAEIFGDAPLETTTSKPRLILDARNVDVADVIGDELNLEHHPEMQNQLARVRAIMGNDTPVQDPAKLIDSLLNDMREELVEGTPEQFFTRLQYDVSKMMDQVLEIGSASILAKTPVRRDELQRVRKKLADQARDIVLFMMRARGISTDALVGKPDGGLMTIDGQQFKVVPGMYRPGMPRAHKDTVLDPELFTKPISVSYLDDILNDDVAKSYPKSDCLPVGFADDFTAKSKPADMKMEVGSYRTKAKPLTKE